MADQGSATLEPLVVEGTLGRRLGEFAVAVSFTVFGLLSAFPPSGEYLLPWLVIPASVLGALHYFRRAFDRRPRLVVDAEGIIDRSYVAGGEIRIPWAEVLSVEPVRDSGAVELSVRDPAALRARAGLPRRAMMLFERLFGKRTVTISPMLLGMGPDQLRERLDAELLRFERRQMGLDGEADAGAIQRMDDG